MFDTLMAQSQFLSGLKAPFVEEDENTHSCVICLEDWAMSDKFEPLCRHVTCAACVVKVGLAQHPFSPQHPRDICSIDVSADCHGCCGRLDAAAVSHLS